METEKPATSASSIRCRWIDAAHNQLRSPPPAAHAATAAGAQSSSSRRGAAIPDPQGDQWDSLT
eukprot:scaffold246504_cov30-Tisochrysis_lutea.AAC.1